MLRPALRVLASRWSLPSGGAMPSGGSARFRPARPPPCSRRGTWGRCHSISISSKPAFQEGGECFRRGDEVGAATVFGPRDRVVRWPVGPGRARSSRRRRRASARGGFGEELRSIHHVHGHVLGVAAVEGSVRIRQAAARRRSSIPHLSLHAQAGRSACWPLPQRGSVMSMPLTRALEALREVACRSTQAAADVKEVLPGADRQSVGQLKLRRKTARMKMIDRRQILDGQCIQRLAHLAQRRLDGTVDVALSPMVGNCLCI